MIANDVCPQYLEDAERRGRVRTIGGSIVVVGPSMDPETMGRAALIEYAEPLLLDSQEGVAELVREVADGFPDARVVLARGRRAVEHAGWQPVVTYLRWQTRTPPEAAGDFTVSPVNNHEKVATWLSHAMKNAAPRLADAEIARQVASITADPRLLALGAVDEGELLGLASLIVPEHDPVTGLDFVDLLDIWVDDGTRRQEVTSALLGAVAKHSEELRLPVVGNVSHRSDDLQQAKGVLSVLIATGWKPWYSISRFALDAP